MTLVKGVPGRVDPDTGEISGRYPFGEVFRPEEQTNWMGFKSTPNEPGTWGYTLEDWDSSGIAERTAVGVGLGVCVALAQTSIDAKWDLSVVRNYVGKVDPSDPLPVRQAMQKAELAPPEDPRLKLPPPIGRGNMGKYTGRMLVTYATAGAMYAIGDYTAQTLRGKNDQWNAMWGGFAMGLVAGVPKMSPMRSVLSGIFLGGISLLCRYEAMPASAFPPEQPWVVHPKVSIYGGPTREAIEE
ncbi:hypothetical protein FVE85_9468 [Porphyridium purpureum]|uniref:Uncharacterized protein n=1 Tax=Porphyridium purpureum TaxID=35688 RepID=A0A5J4YKM7_PORPP|nr:hypothetical protein FVE85_9468 [Porphyridium purpureum]|eukprot:POR6130..scf261_15